MVEGTAAVEHAVEHAVVKGAMTVAKGTEEVFKNVSTVIVEVARGKYTLENASKRSVTAKFVDRPHIGMSRARRVTVEAREKAKEEDREAVMVQHRRSEAAASEKKKKKKSA